MSKRFRKLWDPALTPTNTSLVFTISRIVFVTSPSQFIFANGKFHIANSSRHLRCRILARFSLVLHLILILRWFQGYLHISSDIAFWKAVMMTYFLAVYIALLIVLVHETRVLNDVLFLLNYCIQIETQWVAERTSIIVHRYYLLFANLLNFTVLDFPIAITVLSLFQPCMPPLLSSMLILDCKSWSDDGGSRIMSRIGIALVEGYTWTMAASIAGFTIIVVLTYPVEIILLWITLLRRKIQFAVNPNLLTKYRFVQITTKLFNDVWKMPAMSAMVATCVIIEIVALFILTTSLDKLPLPITGLFLLLAIIFFNDEKQLNVGKAFHEVMPSCKDINGKLCIF
ncbi:hypothetical protein Fcan01_11453 [Folsomia candida]|uniref:Uncharacterized protein n=1 Tax=Folsomia candida TaxID=158441 RepID=A0A226EC28_FOLCA|nr:hypothetical protein Fcan01_11453 [Folsomia candida]